MVMRQSPPDEHGSDRAQLLLIGAIGIAVVIIGITVVINSVLITENTATTEALQSGEDISRFDTTAQENLRSIVLRLNHRGRNRSADQLTRYIHRNVTNYTRLLGETYTEGNAALINVSYNNDSSEWGYRIVQTRDGKFNSPDISNIGACGTPDVCNQSTWTVTNRTDVSRFIVNVNSSVTDSTNTTISFTNDSQEFVNVSLREESGGLIEVNTESNIDSFENDSDVLCEPSNDRVLLDIYTGSSFTGDCSFSGAKNLSDPDRTLDPPYNVTIDDGENTEGSFSLVVNRSRRVEYNVSGSYPAAYQRYEGCDGTVGPISRDDPCRAPVVWQANMTVTYDSPNSNYWQQHNVSIYP
jgi:hypothetical protein